MSHKAPMTPEAIAVETRGPRCGDPRSCSRKAVLWPTLVGRGSRFLPSWQCCCITGLGPPFSLVCLLGWRLRTVDVFPFECTSDYRIARSGALRATPQTVTWSLFFVRRALRIWPLYYAALTGVRYCYRSHTHSSLPGLSNCNHCYGSLCGQLYPTRAPRFEHLVAGPGGVCLSSSVLSSSGRPSLNWVDEDLHSSHPLFLFFSAGVLAVGVLRKRLVALVRHAAGIPVFCNWSDHCSCNPREASARSEQPDPRRPPDRKSLVTSSHCTFWICQLILIRVSTARLYIHYTALFGCVFIFWQYSACPISPVH